jgi:hypothetical protein
MSDSQLPLRYDLEVSSDGRIQVELPLPAGSHVTIYVVEQADAESTDLLAASVSSTDFWENPEDDEDWNHA